MIKSHTIAMQIVYVLILIVPVSLQAQSDPGPRVGAAAVGKPLDGLTGPQTSLFNAGLDEFKNIDKVPDGLGPRMNLDSCAGCHAQPTVGGTSPPNLNPQFDFFQKNCKRPTICRASLPRVAQFAKRGSSSTRTVGPPMAASIQYSPSRDLQARMAVFCGNPTSPASCSVGT